MKIYDTLTGVKREFVPLGDEVRMYVCGITPYSSAHVGHAMSAVAFDVIRRYLENRGHKVNYVQNFTDVDDKLIDRANLENVDVAELAKRYIAEYLGHLATLNVKRADHYPRATEEIPQMIVLIEGLVTGGSAYASGGDVYFRVTKDRHYGKLSHRSIDSMRAGARVESGIEKEHPMDFALWKGAKPGEPAWDSPWGPGRPGWHIECSAMALHYLGQTVDIHGGGQDLVFPHHENEIAQSEAYNDGMPLARFWMHNGMMLFDDEKMSKSRGNLVTIGDALGRYSADTIRHLVLSSHYRSPAIYSDLLMSASTRAITRLRQALGADGGLGAKLDPSPFRERFIGAMDDDFNTPQALAALFELAHEINRAADERREVSDAQDTLRILASEVLGFSFEERKVALAGEKVEQIETLVAKRAALRRERQFAEADSVREELAAMNVVLTDTADGTNWQVEAG